MDCATLTSWAKLSELNAQLLQHVCWDVGCGVGCGVRVLGIGYGGRGVGGEGGRGLRDGAWGLWPGVQRYAPRWEPFRNF